MPLRFIIEKTAFASLPERGIGDEANVEARAEAMVKDVWRLVMGHEEKGLIGKRKCISSVRADIIFMIQRSECIRNACTQQKFRHKRSERIRLYLQVPETCVRVFPSEDFTTSSRSSTIL